MSASPIELPGYPTVPLRLAPLPDVVRASELDWREKCEAREKNVLDYEVTVNHLGLPSADFECDWDAVRVTSSNIGVLVEWLAAKGGTVTKVDTGFGVNVWTLDTVAGADDDYVGCRVLVTVAVPESGWVPCEVSSAVAA